MIPRDQAQDRFFNSATIVSTQATIAKPAANREIGPLARRPPQRDRRTILINPRHGHRANQRGRVRMPRRADQFRRRPVFDDLAAIHHHRARAHITHQGDVVRNVDRGQAESIAHLPQHVQNAGAHTDVQHRHRLIGDDEVWIEDQRARQHDALQLPAG
jgi:hypothetical protein